MSGYGCKTNKAKFMPKNPIPSTLVVLCHIFDVVMMKYAEDLLVEE